MYYCGGVVIFLFLVEGCCKVNFKLFMGLNEMDVFCVLVSVK